MYQNVQLFIRSEIRDGHGLSPSMGWVELGRVGSNLRTGCVGLGEIVLIFCKIGILNAAIFKHCLHEIRETKLKRK